MKLAVLSHPLFLDDRLRGELYNLVCAFFFFPLLFSFHIIRDTTGRCAALSILLSTSAPSRRRVRQVGWNIRTCMRYTVVWHECAQRARDELRFLRVYIAFTDPPPPPRSSAMSLILIVVAGYNQLKRELATSECPPISGFRLNVAQVLPVQLERDLKPRIETGPRTRARSVCTYLLAFSLVLVLYTSN